MGGREGRGEVDAYAGRTCCLGTQLLHGEVPSLSGAGVTDLPARRLTMRFTTGTPMISGSRPPRRCSRDVACTRCPPARAQRVSEEYMERAVAADQEALALRERLRGEEERRMKEIEELRERQVRCGRRGAPTAAAIFAGSHRAVFGAGVPQRGRERVASRAVSNARGCSLTRPNARMFSWRKSIACGLRRWAGASDFGRQRRSRQRKSVRRLSGAAAVAAWPMRAARPAATGDAVPLSLFRGADLSTPAPRAHDHQRS